MLFAVAAPLDRRRACSANDHSCMPACGRGNGNRNSFIASPGAATALSRAGPRLAVTTATSQPITRGSQIPIAPARRTAVPIPARGFLPRGLSDACPRSARHRQVTGRHLITLNGLTRSTDDRRMAGFGKGFGCRPDASVRPGSGGPASESLRRKNPREAVSA